ncbi:MAG TPA: ATP-binding cassette domain-containing protein [Thermotogota bacterium]|jgi:NitT/TauT family transport system ATP-binding protein|nr:ABC transporter ATP-binding protein [Thermotogota bacterium]NLH19768.1 ABC transporter ATP-binding protein [Thermotogaceae bacterium]OQC31383.1 MAG: Aliphatic sulfonates import ATP-binding protein SsuB [Thermotogota bacterium ADurb.Bin062]HNW46458.1 ATP-binding cassette domain-containing protein [Thermotogota bacterium]HNY81940.1 ATP-binding cassette domain-containing protein [Thermotogota bacterium]
MEHVVLKGIHKAFGRLRVLDGIDLVVERQHAVALLGPSGCGKTTLIRMVAGLEKPDRGEIATLPGGVSFAFQEPRLIPWKTVRENLTFFLPEPKIDSSFLDAFELTEILDAYPHQLSGGLKQKVNIGRALLLNKPLLLLDEPFQNIDVNTRVSYIRSITERRKEEGFTMILITHNLREALLFADRLVFFGPKPARIVGEWLVKRPPDQSFRSFDWLFEEERKVVALFPEFMI